jgi:mannose-6-phosphate isomerase-like protein (cupin superfamily)
MKYDPERLTQWIIDLLCGIEEMDKKPYRDERLTDDIWLRTFDPTITSSDEYVWHRDERDRVITVLEGEGWQFQFDNEIPIRINRNDEFIIPKQVYHRIIVGNTPLKLRIEEV